jgi:hypothetical protein
MPELRGSCAEGLPVDRKTRVNSGVSDKLTGFQRRNSVMFHHVFQ